MSFFSIKDPVERERLVEDYKRLKQEIKERDEREKSFGQDRYRMLQERFHPVIQAQTDMTEKIVKSLRDMNPQPERLQPGQVVKAKRRKLSEIDQDDYGPLAKAYKDKYETRNEEIDITFGGLDHKTVEVAI